MALFKEERKLVHDKEVATTKDSGATEITKPDTVPGGDSPLVTKNIPQFPVMNSPFAMFGSPIPESRRGEASPLCSPEIPSPDNPIRLAPISSSQISLFGPKITIEEIDDRSEIPLTTTRLLTSRSHQALKIYPTLTERKHLPSSDFLESDHQSDYQEIKSKHDALQRSISNQNYRLPSLPSEIQVKEVKVEHPPPKSDSLNQVTALRNSRWFVEPSFIHPQRLTLKSSKPEVDQKGDVSRPIYKPLVRMPTTSHCVSRLPADGNEQPRLAIPNHSLHARSIRPPVSSPIVSPYFATGQPQSQPFTPLFSSPIILAYPWQPGVPFTLQPTSAPFFCSNPVPVSLHHFPPRN